LDKREYPNLYEYLTILLVVCNPLIPHTPGYYIEESFKGDPKMLARDFEPNISWIS